MELSDETQLRAMTLTQGMVYVIDDDEGFRNGLQRLLNVAGLSCAAYGSAGEFLIERLKVPREDEPACILLDITMPGPSGIDLMRAMGVQHGAPPIIFVTGHDDIMTSVDMMKCGAVDYLLKPVSAERLLTVVHRALRMDIERRTAESEMRDLVRRFESLTLAERAVFEGVVRHRLNKQLAVQLGVCERTVKSLRARMMEKLQMNAVPDLVRASRRIELEGMKDDTAERSFEHRAMRASLQQQFKSLV